MGNQLIIFGAGEMATLARFYFEHDGGRKVAAFTVDDQYVREPEVDSLSVVPWSEAIRRYDPSEYDCFVGLGFENLNALRRSKFEACRAAGYTLPTYISTKAVTWPDLECGQNCLILENNSVNPRVKIGNNVIVWSSNSLGHGSVIEDHVYVASQVCIAGNCRIGESSLLGVSSAVRDHCRVGAQTFVGMGACVTHDVPPRSVILGPNGAVANPAAAEFVRQRL